MGIPFSGCHPCAIHANTGQGPGLITNHIDQSFAAGRLGNRLCEMTGFYIKTHCIWPAGGLGLGYGGIILCKPGTGEKNYKKTVFMAFSTD
jgi:hypothetical protein